MRGWTYPHEVPGASPLPPARTLSDGALVARVRAGAAEGREAEIEVCRRFAPRIRLYGLRHLRDADAAADLVQEVLFSVLDRLRSGAIREPERLGSFVLGTCRLEASQGRRGSARRGALLARYGGGLAPAEPQGARVDVDRLEGCLDRLPSRERAVLQLTFFAERATEAIATELDTTPGNVRVVRHRALARLRACMGTEEVT
jgi:RNA polymerase sigma-70 factor (ECF subfamily)